VLLIAGFRELSQANRQTQRRYQWLRSLESQSRIFSFDRPPAEWPHFQKDQDEHPMNLNFAFACMVVVSFAIALGHA
jgi:hypothetical protein